MPNEKNQSPTPENNINADNALDVSNNNTDVNSPNFVNVVNPLTRRNARRYALQAMYQWQIAGTSVTDIELEFLQYQIDRQLDLLYFKELLRGIPEFITEIDSEIRPFLSRAFADIDPIELAVLRIATYELMKRPDVPYRVIINEALELTKKFGSIEGYKFVNGMLDRIAKKLRALEITESKNFKKE